MSETAKPTATGTDAGAPEANVERIEREAREWLQRLVSEKVGPADLAALDRWRAEGPEHRRAFARANLLWDVLGKVAREAEVKDAVRQTARALLARPVGRRALLAGSVAASAAYLMARPPLHLWPAVSELMAPYRTGTGERRQLAIASGIAVEMDTQTSLTAPVAADQHYALELISGQLAISVQADAARPVVIIAADGQSQADQANFDVRRAGSSVCVTCVEGAVEISYRSTLVTLGPGQQATYGGGSLGSAVAADPAVVTAWQRGLLVFHDVPLAQVVEEVNRYRPGRIILLNQTLAERRVVAGFRLDRIEDVVSYLVGAFGARTRSLPGGVVLVS
jgi:transmembrane sensor